MRVRLLEEIDSLPYDLDWAIYPSIAAAAKDLGCDARHLSAQLKGKRKETKTNAGKVTQIKVYNEQANSTTSTVPEHTDHAKENPAVGYVAPHRGWGRLEQAVVKATFAVQWVRSKFNKPKDVV
jgi:hypothetical protein